MPQEPHDNHLGEDICVNLFNVSAAMVGVCLTVIGLVSVVISVRQVDTLADDFLALDALLFLVSCLSAYWASRTRKTRRMYRLERFADVVFMLAMVLMVLVCAFITYFIPIH